MHKIDIDVFRAQKVYDGRKPDSAIVIQTKEKKRKKEFNIQYKN